MVRQTYVVIIVVATIVLGFPEHTAADTPGAWQSVGPMSVGRHVVRSLVRLLDGRVLMAGGWDGGAFPDGVLAGAEIFNPTTGRWSPTASMVTARHYPTATILADGRVLVAGGNTPHGIVASAELYDPVLGSWMPAASMTTPRAGATATLLTTGMVLVAGGTARDAGPQAFTDSAEIYDPATNTWIDVPAMASVRTEHDAVRLQDGRVLVVGGFTQDPAIGGATTAEVFDPVSRQWSSTGPLSVGRYEPAVTRLHDGRVLVAGGENLGIVVDSVEIYDPTTNSWSPAAPMGTPRQGTSAVTLANGEVFVAGGLVPSPFSPTSAETYDPQTNTWAPTASAHEARYLYGMTQLLDGRVLVVGGCCTGAEPYGLPTAEIFTPAFECPPDVTAAVNVVRFPFQEIPFTPFRFQWVIVHNRTTDPIGGPLSFVMDDLQNAAFIGSPFRTRCLSDAGSPLMLVSAGSDNVLIPNEIRLTGLWFFKTDAGAIVYTPRVLSGIPRR